MPPPLEAQSLNHWTTSEAPTLFFGAFPGGSDSKEFACNVGDLGLILGLGRSPGGGNGNPLQYSCLENSMDRGAWWAPGGQSMGLRRVRYNLITNTFTFTLKLLVH